MLSLWVTEEGPDVFGRQACVLFSIPHCFPSSSVTQSMNSLPTVIGIHPSALLSSQLVALSHVQPELSTFGF